MTMVNYGKIPRRIYTTDEFAAQIRKLGGRASADYVRKCCDKRPDTRTGKPYRLPDGWFAKRNRTGRWEIYPDDSGVPIVGNVPLDLLIKELSIWLATLEQPIEDWRLYAAVRARLFSQFMEGYIKEGKGEEAHERLGEFEKRWIHMLSDEELAGALAERWTKSVRLEKLSDLPEGLKVLEAVPGQSKRFLKLSPELKDAAELLARLRSTYELAVRERAPAELRIKMLPDGSWRVATDEQFTGDLFHQVFVDSWSIGKLKLHLDGFAELYVLSWLRDIFQRVEPTGTTGDWYKSPVIREHGSSARFRRHCLYCGTEIHTPRPNKKFCQGQCRTSYLHWLEALTPIFSKAWSTNKQTDDVAERCYVSVRQRLHKRLDVVLGNAGIN